MWRTTAALTAATAGVTHILVAFGHYAHTPAQGIFLSLIGVIQLTWALLFWLRPAMRFFLVGQLVTGGVLVLWLLAYTILAPFGAHIQPVDWAVGLTKAAELVSWFALMSAAWHREIIDLRRQPLPTIMLLTLGICLSAGSVYWLTGLLLEPVLPQLSHSYGQHQFQRPVDQILGFLGTILPGQSRQEQATTEGWNLPPGFPAPRVPIDNPPTVEKIELGRYLFYDPRLSGNETQSCSSCHIQSLAFSDGKVTAQGSTGELHPRNSQALVNVAYDATLTWANPALVEIEQQILVPLFGEQPVEMGVTGQEAAVLARFQNDPDYQTRFAAAFPDQPEPITYHTIAQALASFVRSLVSGNSAYDQYVAGEKRALSPAAQAGMELFFSERFECHHCHTGFNFSIATVHDKSTFSAVSFQNNGLYNLDGAGAYPRGNRGLYESTGKPTDMGRFRPPTLRNIALTAPYMHDGSLTTLEDVVRHYAAGGRLITEGPLAGDGRQNPNKSGLIPGFEMSEAELQALVAFLESLTDETFITDPRFSNPFLTAVNEPPVVANN